MPLIVADASGAFCHLGHRGANKRTRWNRLATAPQSRPSMTLAMALVLRSLRLAADRLARPPVEQRVPLWTARWELGTFAPRPGSFAGRKHVLAASVDGARDGCAVRSAEFGAHDRRHFLRCDLHGAVGLFGAVDGAGCAHSGPREPTGRWVAISSPKARLSSASTALARSR